MTEQRQHNFNVQPSIEALYDVISPLRLGTYLNAAGHDTERALKLYIWNAKMGEAFHIPIQAVEVGLRNRVSDGLQVAYGNEWWRDRNFLRIADKRRNEDIEMVKRRLQNKGKPLSTGQIIASLSFGFWVTMLDSRYNPPIWGAHLKTAFPHLPDNVNRRALQRTASKVADLRNRISHHEPIFRRNLSGDYSECMRMIKWLSPVKAEWIKPHCRVSALLREKP